MEVHDPPNHTRYCELVCPSAAGRIEFLSFSPAACLHKLNFRVADRSSQNGPFLCNVLLSGDWDRPAPEKARSKISRHGRMALLQENRRGSYVPRAACLTIPGSCQRRSVPSHIRSHRHFDLFFLAPLRFFSTNSPRNQAQPFASPERDKTQVRARECGVRSLQVHSRRGRRR